MAESMWTGFLRLSLVSCAIRVAPVVDRDEKKLGPDIVDVEEFVTRSQIDQTYLGSAYYLYPEGQLASDALEALRLAMLRAGRVALGHVTTGEREQAILIEPYGTGLLMVWLMSDEERKPCEFAERAEGSIPTEMIEIVEDIIGRRSSEFDPKRLGARR
jgi:DNA end-binding protein Ku